MSWWWILVWVIAGAAMAPLVAFALKRARQRDSRPLDD